MPKYISFYIKFSIYSRLIERFRIGNMKRVFYFIGLTIGISCIIVGSIVLMFLYSLKCESNDVQDVVDNVIEEYVFETPSTNNEGNANLIDLLKEAFNNEDVIAYIYFPEANISYPIVQDKDNTKYLNTNIWGNYSANGSIFLDCNNNKDFSDTSSIVYGHHMRNGGMFGSLEASCSENINDLQFTIYTRTNKLVYAVKSTEIIDPNGRNGYIHTGKYDSKAFSKYLQSNSILYNPSFEGDNFVTLLTCHYIKGETSRYGVTGVLISNTTYNKEAFNK